MLELELRMNSLARRRTSIGIWDCQRASRCRRYYLSTDATLGIPQFNQAKQRPLHASSLHARYYQAQHRNNSLRGNHHHPERTIATATATAMSASASAAGTPSSPTIVLVTGGNNGIGYEAVKAFLQAEKPYHIVMGSRSLDKANKAIEQLHAECPGATNRIETVQVDLASDESIERAFEQLQASPGRIDALINNAGAAFDGEYMKGALSLRECYNRAYDVNVSGTNVLTHTFMPLLLKSSDPRLLFVTGLSQITKASEGPYFPTPPLPAGWPKKKDYFETIGYRCSKSALNMLMVDWNHRLQADGVKVWAVGPGFLLTDLGGMREQAKGMNAGHPSAGGLILKRVVEGERDHQTGKAVNKDGISLW